MLTKKWPLWLIIVPFALSFLCGCSGGGSQGGTGVNTSTPESAVYEILESWQATKVSGVSLENNQNLVKQETTSAERYIRFKDLAGEEWLLRIDNIEYLSADVARVHARYQSLDANRGSLNLVFLMIRDLTSWYLDDIEVTEVPIVVVTGTGVKGVISDIATNLPVNRALVSIYDQQTNTFIKNTTSDDNGFYSFKLDPGTYYMVIERDGYDALTYPDITVG